MHLSFLTSSPPPHHHHQKLWKKSISNFTSKQASLNSVNFLIASSKFINTLQNACHWHLWLSGRNVYLYLTLDIFYFSTSTVCAVPSFCCLFYAASMLSLCWLIRGILISTCSSNLGCSGVFNFREISHYNQFFSKISLRPVSWQCCGLPVSFLFF